MESLAASATHLTRKTMEEKASGEQTRLRTKGRETDGRAAGPRPRAHKATQPKGALSPLRYSRCLQVHSNPTQSPFIYFHSFLWFSPDLIGGLSLRHQISKMCETSKRHDKRAIVNWFVPSLINYFLILVLYPFEVTVERSIKPVNAISIFPS